MKKYTIIVLLLICYSAMFGQSKTDTTSLFNLYAVKIDSAKQDSLDKICKERGHIFSCCSFTCIGWFPYYVDLEHKTLKISYNPNIMSGVCNRCRRTISRRIQSKPDTTILWEK